MRLHDHTVYRALKDLGFSLEHTRRSAQENHGYRGPRGDNRSVNLRIGSLHEAAASIGCNRYASRLPVGPDLVRCSSTGRLTLSDGGVAAASDATSGQAAIRRALAAKKPNYCNASNAGHWRGLIKRYNFYLCEKLFIGAQLEIVSYSVVVS